MWKKSYILILKKIYWWVFLSEVCRSIKTSFFSLLIFLLKSKAVFVKGVSTMLWQQWVSGIEPKGKNQISTPLASASSSVTVLVDCRDLATAKSKKYYNVIKIKLNKGRVQKKWSLHVVQPSFCMVQLSFCTVWPEFVAMCMTFCISSTNFLKFF